MTDYRPSDAYRKGFPWVPVTLVFGVIAILVLGCLAWFTQILGFTLDTRNVKHQIANQQLLQQSPQYHDGWETKLSDDYTSTLNDQSTEGQVPASDLPSVKAAVLGDAVTVCYDYTKANYPGSTYTDTPPDITAWYQANCTGPAVSLSSPLRK